MNADHMRATAQGYLEAVSTKNLQKIKDMYADNATVEDPVGSDPIEGIAAIEAFYQNVQKLDVTLELSGSIRCAGKFAAFPFKALTGEHTLDVIDVFEFNDEGKVVSMRAFWGG